MGLLAFFFRAIFVLFILRLLGVVARAFFGGFAQGIQPGAAGPRQGGAAYDGPPARGAVEELVKDPICGVHTARSSAVSGRYRGVSAFFCSEECAAKAAASA